MAEKDMIAAAQAALDHMGIDDRIEEVGQFEPRGESGALFAGGMIGSEVGGAFGDVGDAIGVGLGAVGGIEASAASSGLPSHMLVGASASTIYGFRMARMGRKDAPDELLFRVPRRGLEINVHGRVNVRTLELVEPGTGSKIELEGNRLPITHSNDLIKYLAGSEAADAADAQAADAGGVAEPGPD
jgi:hypothetical protein